MVQILNRVLPIIQWIVVAIVHGGGLVVAITLLGRSKGMPARLAAAAFGLLFVYDLSWVAWEAGLDYQIWRLTNSVIDGMWEIRNCCCGLLQVAGFACLIVAIVQALSDTTE